MNEELRIMNYELGGRGIVRGKRSCKEKEFRMKMKGTLREGG